MKKALYIFAAILLAGACTKTLETPGPVLSEDGTVEGKMVTVEFTVPVPTETRGAMGKEPILDGPMYVAMFNKSQVLKQFVQAEFTGTVPTTNGTLGRFKARLLMSKAWRSVHFIANCPVTNPTEIVGEAAVLGSIVTSNGDAAYWQRFVFEDGIDGYTYTGGRIENQPWFEPSITFTYNDPVNPTQYTYEHDGNTITVYVGDYIKQNGTKILSGEGYFASQAVQDVLASVPLVRNFARITVSGAEGGNFTPRQFALAYTPTAGYVAPNDRTKSDSFSDNWGFVSSYLPGAVSMTSFPTDSAVSATGYVPAMPASATISDTAPTTFVSVDDANDNGAYMYERSADLKGQPATCIIVGGTLEGTSGERWFKVQIADPDGAYFNIYRGVSYNIEIGQITGTTGFATAQEAFNNVPVGDISGAPETANLVSVSDNKGSVLTVDAIDHVSLSEDVTYRVLLYRMRYEGVSSPNPTAQATLSVSHVTSAPAIQTIGEGQPYAGGAITLPDGETVTPQLPDSDGGWYYAIVTLNGAQDGVKKLSHVTVKAPRKENAQKFLEREISYRVLGRQELVLSATPISSAVDQQTTLTITIPEDLGYSMFPLIFKIEADQNNLNPVNALNNGIKLPVESGTSYFDPTKNSFYFLFTVDYSDYYDVVTKTYSNTKALVFKTIKTSTNPLKIAVTDKGDYFKTEEAHAVATVTVN